MNKNDIPAANHYLSMFADLTRKVLNTSDQDLISLEDELKIQDDYLQMEQLRFGFKYSVKVSSSINKDNTEIPAMLLQPFVENAVKHGVGALGQNGIIGITIDKQGNDLILAVADNGNGFDKAKVQQQLTSFGLKLSEQRIKLLNQLNKNQPVSLAIDSTPTGTRVTITLTDLLA
jgi:two-component system LytT family sensor kinase